MRFLRNDSTDPYYNMAFDEWCLEHPLEDAPVFYLWRNSPSVIIGTTQDAAAEVNLPFLKSQGILLVRRSTGGGAVYHDLNNLNYSFVGAVSRIDSSLVELVAEGLRSLGVEAQVGGRNDIFVDGRKVSGYAKRIWRDRAIIHGTLMYDVDIDTLTRVLDTPESKLHRKGVASVRSRVVNLKDLLPSGMTLSGFETAMHDWFASGDGEVFLPDEAAEEIMNISKTKYSMQEWIMK